MEGNDNEKTLVTALIKHYEPQAEISEDYYNNIKKKYGDTDNLVTSLIKHYEPKADVSNEYLSGIYKKYGVSKQKPLEEQEAELSGHLQDMYGVAPQDLAAMTIDEKLNMADDAKAKQQQFKQGNIALKQVEQQDKNMLINAMTQQNMAAIKKPISERIDEHNKYLAKTRPITIESINQQTPVQEPNYIMATQEQKPLTVESISKQTPEEIAKFTKPAVDMLDPVEKKNKAMEIQLITNSNMDDEAKQQAIEKVNREGSAHSRKLQYEDYNNKKLFEYAAKETIGQIGDEKITALKEDIKGRGVDYGIVVAEDVNKTIAELNANGSAVEYGGKLYQPDYANYDPEKPVIKVLKDEKGKIHNLSQYVLRNLQNSLIGSMAQYGEPIVRNIMAGKTQNIPDELRDVQEKREDQQRKLTEYDPNSVETILGGVVNLLVDGGIFKVGGLGGAYVGKKLLAPAGEWMLGNLIKAGVPKKAADVLASQFTKDLAAKYFEQTGSMIGALAPHGAAMDVVNQLGERKDNGEFKTIHDIDLMRTLGEFTKSAALAAGLAPISMIGATGDAIIKQSLVKNGAPLYALNKIGTTATEIVYFTGMGSFLEGRMFTVKDFEHNAGIILGLKLMHGAAGLKPDTETMRLIGNDNFFNPGERRIFESVAKDEMPFLRNKDVKGMTDRDIVLNIFDVKEDVTKANIEAIMKNEAIPASVKGKLVSLLRPDLTNNLQMDIDRYAVNTKVVMDKGKPYVEIYDKDGGLMYVQDIDTNGKTAEQARAEADFVSYKVLSTAENNRMKEVIMNLDGKDKLQLDKNLGSKYPKGYTDPIVEGAINTPPYERTAEQVKVVEDLTNAYEKLSIKEPEAEIDPLRITLEAEAANAQTLVEKEKIVNSLDESVPEQLQEKIDILKAEREMPETDEAGKANLDKEIAQLETLQKQADVSKGIDATTKTEAVEKTEVEPTEKIEQVETVEPIIEQTEPKLTEADRAKRILELDESNAGQLAEKIQHLETLKEAETEGWVKQGMQKEIDRLKGLAGEVEVKDIPLDEMQKKSIADRIRSLKVDTKGKAFDVMLGLPIEAYNFAIETVAKLAEGTQKLSSLAKKAIAEIEKKYPDLKFDRFKLEKELNKSINTLIEPEKKEYDVAKEIVKKQIEDIKKSAAEKLETEKEYAKIKEEIAITKTKYEAQADKESALAKAEFKRLNDLYKQKKEYEYRVRFAQAEGKTAVELEKGFQIGRRERIKEFIEANKENIRKVTGRTVENLMRKINNANTPAQVDRAIKYIERAAIDAEYQTDYAAAEKNEGKIKTKLRTTPNDYLNISNEVVDFLNIDKDKLTPAELKEHIDMQEKLLRSRVPDTKGFREHLEKFNNRMKDAEDVDTFGKQLRSFQDIENILTDLEKGSVTDLETLTDVNNKLNRLSHKAINLHSEGFLTDVEYDNIMDRLNKQDAVTGESLLSGLEKEMKQAKGEIIKSLHNRIKSVDTSWMQQFAKEAVDNISGFSKQQLEALKIKDMITLDRVVDGLENGVYNKNMYDTVSKIRASAHQGMIENSLNALTNMKGLLKKAWEGKVDNYTELKNDMVTNTAYIADSEIGLGKEGLRPFYKSSVKIAKALRKIDNKRIEILKTKFDMPDGTQVSFLDALKKFNGMMLSERQKWDVAIGMIQKQLEFMTNDINVTIGGKHYTKFEDLPAEYKNKYEYLNKEKLTRRGDYFDGETKKLYDDVYDMLPKTKDGVIDVEASKKMLPKVVRDTYESGMKVVEALEPFGRNNAEKRGIVYRKLNNYLRSFVREMPQDKGKEGVAEKLDQSPIDRALDFARSNKPTVRAGSVNERTREPYWESYEFTDIVSKHMEEVLTDHYITDVVREIWQGSNQAATNMRNLEASRYVKPYQEALEDRLRTELRLQTKNMDYMDYFIQKGTQYMRAKYLAKPLKLIRETVSNSLRAFITTGMITPDDIKASLNPVYKELFENENSLILEKFNSFRDDMAKKDQTWMDNALAWTITRPDNIVGKTMFIKEFNKSFKKQTGEDFSTEKYHNDISYREKWAKEISQGIENSEIKTQEAFNSLGTVMAPSKVKILPFSGKGAWIVERDSKIGRMTNFMMSFSMNETGQLIKNLGDMATGQNQGKGEAARKVLATITSNALYNSMRAVTPAFMTWALGNEEDAKKDWEKMQKNSLGIIASVGTGLMAGQYSNVVRPFLSMILGTMKGSMSKEEWNQADLDWLTDFGKQGFMAPPVDIMHYGRGADYAKLVPVIGDIAAEMAVNGINAMDIIYQVKNHKDGAASLVDPNEKAAWDLLNLINAGLLWIAPNPFSSGANEGIQVFEKVKGRKLQRIKKGMRYINPRTARIYTQEEIDEMMKKGINVEDAIEYTGK